MLQPSIRDLGSEQLQVLELCQTSEVFQSSVGCLLPQAQRLESRQTFRGLPAQRRGLRSLHAQRLEVGQTFQVCQAGVGHLGTIRFSDWSWVNPFRFASPVSVTLVHVRSSDRSWDNPSRFTSPASVTRFPPGSAIGVASNLSGLPARHR